jgi:hypothetical protein
MTSHGSGRGGAFAAGSRAGAQALVAVVASAVLVAGCRANTDCSCPPVAGGIVLQAPTGVVQSIQTEGATCGDAQIRCVPLDFASKFTPHCAEYQILPRRPGDCHVAVTTADGEWTIGSGVDAATDT